MLCDVSNDVPLSQGNIIDDVPFLIIPKTLSINLFADKERVNCAITDIDSLKKMKEKSKAESKGLLVSDVTVEISHGLIISHDCDNDNKDSIIVARIFPLSQYIKSLEDAKTHDEPLVEYDIKKRVTENYDFVNLIYLSKPSGTEILCADLLRQYTFPKKGWAEYFKKKRIKSLNEQGVKYLQGRLAVSTARFATEAGFWHDEKDKEISSTANGKAIKEAHDRLQTKKIESKSSWKSS